MSHRAVCGRALTLALLLAALGQAALAQSPSVDIVKGPYLQRVSRTSIIIMWETSVAAPSRVDFGKATPNEFSVQTPRAVTIHEVTLSCLEAGTAYQYTVTSGTAASAVNTFTTAPPGAQGFQFAAYGDSRGDDDTFNAAHLAVVNAIIASGPAIVLHTGDIANPGGDPGAWWPQFFGPAADLIKNTTLFPSPGNHEYIGDPAIAAYRRYFSLPSANEHWYSFDYGCAHFVCLDTNVVARYAPGSAQYRWLVQDLGAASRDARWIIVFFHHPPFTSTSGHSDDLNVQKYLLPLFEQFHVDLVFSGHSHGYERYLNNGIPYIVTGGGGAPLYDLEPRTGPPALLAGASVYHHCFIAVSPDALLCEARGNDGTPFDAFSLAQSATAPVAVDDAAATAPSTPVLIKVLANDSDSAGYPLTLAAVTQPANGSAAANPNGTVAYTPKAGFVGTDSFAYTISDRRGATASASVTVAVRTPANLCGWITQADGTPIRGIGVKLGRMNSHSAWVTVASATTNAAGYYEFRKVKPGTALCRVLPVSRAWTFTPPEAAAVVISSAYQLVCSFTASRP